MQKSIFIIFLFYLNVTFSQNYNAEYVITEVKKPQINDSLSNSYKSLMKYNIKIMQEYSKVLKINVKSSSDNHFLHIDEIMTKSDGYSINSKLVFGLMDIYQNLYFDGNSTYYYYDSDVFVTQIESEDVKWVIKKGQTKKILGYNCLLATPVNNTKINFGPNFKELQVWFCPEINLSSSPLIYGKLPGLVVALENRFIKLQLSNLEITEDNIISLGKFLNGKDVYSLEEADKYHKKVADRITGGRYKK